MILSFLLIAQTAVQPVRFPDDVIASEFAKGVQVAKGITSRDPLKKLMKVTERSHFKDVIGSDRKSIGWWTNGSSKVPVEQIYWMSPSLTSRWLGFLSRREYWKDDEAPARWHRIVESLDGKLNFLVQLSAYPKMPLHGFGDYEKPRLDDFENVRFVLSSGNHNWALKGELIRSLQSREKGPIDEWPWWIETRIGTQLASEYDLLPESPMMFGDYYRSWYWVSISIPEYLESKFEVKVISKGKERVASFNLAG